MANKATFRRLMSGYPFVKLAELVAYNAEVLAEWQRLSDTQRAALIQEDYRTRIWAAGYAAGTARADAPEARASACAGRCAAAAETAQLRAALEQIAQRAHTMTGTPLGAPREERRLWQWMGHIADRALAALETPR